MLVYLLACSDYNVNLKDEDPGTFDSTPDTDSVPLDTDSATTDSDGETATPPSCEDQSFPAIAVAQLDECAGETTIGTFTPIIEWNNPDPGNVYTTPMVGQLNDDNGDGVVDVTDTPDIVVAEVDADIWALSGDGTVHWNVGGGTGSADNPMSPAIADLDGDGFPEIVASSIHGTFAYHGEDGSTMWEVPGVFPSDCGAVGVADMDADGSPEVILGNIILNGLDGTLRGSGEYGFGGEPYWGAQESVTADLDRDGALEVVAGNALYDSYGEAIWYNGEEDGMVAVANFDSDPEGEIVVSSNGQTRLQDTDGTVIWSVGSYGLYASGPPTIADFDGDGAPEIGIASESLYQAFDTDGALMWSQPIVDPSSGITGSSAFDFEGDGATEIVMADENSLYVFDGATGTIRMEEAAHSSLTCTEYPTIADVDGDGHAEIIYTSYAYSGPERGITVVGDADDSWMPTGAAWSQHGYSITNVEADGFTIPTTPAINWDTYNSFRAAAPGEPPDVPPGADIVPVVLDVCVDECALGNVTVWFALANQGYLPVTDALAVDVYGETDTGRVLLGSFAWTAPLPEGQQSASVSLELTGVPTPLYDVVVSVDGGNGKDDGVLHECIEDNDERAWGTAVCL